MYVFMLHILQIARIDIGFGVSWRPHEGHYSPPSILGLQFSLLSWTICFPILSMFQLFFFSKLSSCWFPFPLCFYQAGTGISVDTEKERDMHTDLSVFL